MIKLGRWIESHGQQGDSSALNLPHLSVQPPLPAVLDRRRASWLRRYGLALLTVGIALLPKLLVSAIDGPSSFLPFVLAVMVSAWYGGMLPGLFATLLSSLFINCFWAPPIGTLAIDRLLNGLPLLQFVLVGVAISWLNEQLHEARRRAEAIAREARHHQVALQESDRCARTANQQMSEILESISDAFYVVDGSWRFTYVNQEAERLWGKQRQDLLGQVIWEVFPQAIGSISDRKFHEAVRERRAVEFETFSIAMQEWVEVNAYPTGQGLTVHFRNIAERKATEVALHDSEERLRLALEGAALGMWDYNLVSGELKWTTQCKVMFGLPAEIDVTYPIFMNAVHPDDRQRVQQAVEQSIAQRQVYDLEYRSQWSDGTVRWLAAKGQTFCNEKGEPMRMVGVVLDVTDRKQLEDSLRQQTQALEQANHFKDDFLAIVSHELRAPLNAILGWVQILRTRTIDPATTARALETIERNARSQTQLIADLLEISRLIRGKVRLSLAPIALATVIQTSLETMRPSAEAKQIQLTSSIAPHVGQVLGDSERLQQVIWNLLSNAIKFTPEGGKVEVTLQQVGAQAQIQVSDTGKGISPAFLPHVFERFRQADSSITRTQGGLGLGLAIVRQLAELHGGTVAVSSAGEGQGSTFTVTLPLLPSAEESPTALIAGNGHLIPSIAGMRVLVVDDEADARELLVILLGQAGVKVTAVASGVEAMKAIVLSHPDVIICDIGMPREDGYTLIRKIRELPAAQGGTIPAIALTAYVREEDRQQAEQAGFQQHLAKPIDTQLLFSTIEQLSKRGAP